MPVNACLSPTQCDTVSHFGFFVLVAQSVRHVWSCYCVLVGIDQHFLHERLVEKMIIARKQSWTSGANVSSQMPSVFGAIECPTLVNGLALLPTSNWTFSDIHFTFSQQQRDPHQVSLSVARQQNRPSTNALVSMSQKSFYKASRRIATRSFLQPPECPESSLCVEQNRAVTPGLGRVLRPCLSSSLSVIVLGNEYLLIDNILVIGGRLCRTIRP